MCHSTSLCRKMYVTHKARCPEKGLLSNVEKFGAVPAVGAACSRGNDGEGTEGSGISQSFCA